MFFARPVRIQAGLLLSAALGGVLPLAGLPASARGWDLSVAGGGASLRFPLPAGTFELSWIHSVERTEWRETYTVDRTGEIVLVASEFSSGGAGLPERVGEGETFSLKDGRMRIEGRNLRIGDLRIRLSGVSRHFLWVAGRRVDLNARFGEGVVTIHAEP
jgi:hypothetical protein